MIGSSRRPIVKVVESWTQPPFRPSQVPAKRYTAECHTQGCTWTSGSQVVKVAAEELARVHRDFHRKGGAR